RPRRLVVHRAQELQALLAVGDAARKARIHLAEPALSVGARAERHRRYRLVCYERRQARAHRVAERFVLLRTRQRGHRKRTQQGESEPPQASFWRMKGTMSASGTSLPLSSRRALYSAFPAARPRSPSTTRCGMPIKSMSAKSTPGRSSRSSSSTSTPACTRSWYSRSVAARTAALFW